ncbi:KaiC domain-containing protein [Haloarcula onubensis]|uniref:KaiC domain-containing protein n=1 Tax=Haloarcula onubensis TaxID=2950539 RepID=A0ABU2FRF2_9EURY|nr:KaiC domain-containing protein [Halomicroarcula sp. S3CR25-11]MDS0283338.1 KaiC domain-containing protein [Halomicroarcula sp. S3CR25-11]
MSEGTDDRDDDWFERALEEDPEDADATADESVGSGGEAGDSEGASGHDGEAESPFEDSGSESPFEDSGSESPFEDSGSESPFEDSGSESPFEDSGDDADDGGSLFGDDFATAFESAGAPGGGGGGSDAEFEDEDFDSDIPRIDVGIEGLDRMIQGGIPRRHLIVAIGSAGTGKTTFGLQFLHHGLENGENCVFITLEQSHAAIMGTADDRDWGFDAYEADNQLAVVDLDPVEMANSLDNIRGELPGLIEDFDADRLVLDSVSLLEMMYDNPAKRRTEVFDFTRSLKAAGVTTMLTSEASEDNPYASRHGIIEYLTDAVFVLQYVRSETRETRLAVEIQKIRNANHSRETKPYEITMDGISVYQQANIF